MNVKCSRRSELLAAIDHCAERYDEDEHIGVRAQTAGRVLSEVARIAGVQRRTLSALEEPLAASLPENVEDIDGAEVLEWLRRQLPITWVEDRLLLPESLYPELVALAREALREVVQGELTPTQRATIARQMFARVLPDHPKEKDLADAFIQLAWGSRHEPEHRAQLAVEWMEEELHIVWLEPPRDVRPYSPTDTYEVGDSVEHPSFGRGVVKARTDTSIEVAFSDRARKLSVAKR